MAELFCGECGGKLDSGALFCTECGALINTRTEEISPDTAEPDADNRQPAYLPGQTAPRHPDQVQSKNKNYRSLLISLLMVAMIGILITGFFLIRFLMGDRSQSGLPLSLQESDITTTIDQTTTKSTENEPTEISVTDSAAYGLPASPTWLTDTMLERAQGAGTERLRGMYEGVALIRDLENAEGLLEDLSVDQIQSLSESFGQERPVIIDYYGSFLDLSIDLPNIGYMLFDSLELNLAGQHYFIEERSSDAEQEHLFYLYRILVIPQADTIRLIGRFETTITSDQPAHIALEFDVQQVLYEEDPEQTTGSETNISETPQTDLESGLLPASAYVPAPGQIYLYDVYYVSGEYGLEEVVVGKKSDTVLSSVSIFMLEDDETFLSEQYDFIEKEDGIYLDYGEGYESLWLPADYEEFMYWENEWEAFMILAVNQTFETADEVFENCLIRSYEIPEADYFVTQVLAPGHGVIHHEYSPDVPARELLVHYTVDLETANSFLQR